MTYTRCGHRTEGGLVGECPICKVDEYWKRPDVFECVHCSDLVEGKGICDECHKFLRAQKIFDNAKIL